MLFKYRPKKANIFANISPKVEPNFSHHESRRFFFVFVSAYFILCLYMAKAWSTFTKIYIFQGMGETETEIGGRKTWTFKDGCLECIKNSRFLFTISFGCVPTRIAIICILKAHLKSLCLSLWIVYVIHKHFVLYWDNSEKGMHTGCTNDDNHLRQGMVVLFFTWALL